MKTAPALRSASDLDALDFDKGGGLVTVVAQDARTGRVLQVAHADRDALERTLATGQMHYRSRTRGPWHKGATSGNVQRVVALHVDCDCDAVLALVEPAGPACHTGAATCFGSGAAGPRMLDTLDAVIAERAAGLGGTGASHTRRLLNDRNLRLKKIGEEAAELLVTLTERDAPAAVEEAADLVYHVLVALRALGVGLREVEQALARRAERHRS